MQHRLFLTGAIAITASDRLLLLISVRCSLKQPQKGLSASPKTAFSPAVNYIFFFNCHGVGIAVCSNLELIKFSIIIYLLN